MPHIALPEGLAGITAGFAFRPETAKPMRELAHILLHEANSLTPGERELIATYVSSQNDCYFCQTSHGAAAACHLGSSEIVKQVKTDFESAPVSPKLKALLAIAGKVQQSGKNVTSTDIDRARRLGATEMEIHDTVLIAAAFCMFNRYVDGLGTWQPRDETMYAQMGKHLAEEGYRKRPAEQPEPEYYRTAREAADKELAVETK
ncbi:MAG: peroxidase-related enzyme [Silvibacterium sp.]|nr:peroxidase-related enzyme [Silvibacterium sp.]